MPPLYIFVPDFSKFLDCPGVLYKHSHHVSATGLPANVFM